MTKKHYILRELRAYCKKVIGGKEPACKKHVWACQRFLRDIDKQKTKGFLYRFDQERAERFLSWMNLFEHTKGPLAGTLKVPEPIEKFIFANIYGWVHKKTGYRRFRNAYWQVARKNAKSQDLAMVATYELAAMEESSSEVYIAATKKEQTKYVWEEAERIVRRCDLLRDKFHTKYGVMYHDRSDSAFTRMTEEDKKKGDGGNPQCGIIDEYHAHETDEFYNILTSGMKTRTQPLLIIITTAGFNMDHPCYRDEYVYTSQILDPDSEIENDRYFVMINELDKNKDGELIDDINDPKVWEKANPILRKSKEGMDALAAELVIAKDKPEKMRDFLTKSMNVWVSMPEAGYMDMEKWKKCAGKIPDLQGEQCIVGLDMSAKIDLTSVTFEFLVEDKYYIVSHSFMPMDTINARRDMDRVPYDTWVTQGWITAISGSVIDYKQVKDYVLEKTRAMGWDISEVCVDPWGTLQLQTELQEEEGLTVSEIVQGIKTLSEPTKDFRNMVYSGRVVHENNPVLNWAVGNAIIDKVDRNENIILNKKKSKSRIDPIAATINAHVRAMVYEKSSGVGVMFI